MMDFNSDSTVSPLTVGCYQPFPSTSDATSYYYYTAYLTEADVRRVVREEIERALGSDASVKKAQIAALKKRLKELESA